MVIFQEKRFSERRFPDGFFPGETFPGKTITEWLSLMYPIYRTHRSRNHLKPFTLRT